MLTFSKIKGKNPFFYSILIAAFLLLLISLFSISDENSSPQRATHVQGEQIVQHLDPPHIQKQTVKVTRVIDGDTIEIETGARVRYIGINAPETVNPKREVQCFGKEATAKNRELVEGKEVRLEKDISETDKSGRLLRYVYLDNMMVNEWLVAEGYAYASSFPPDIKYQDLLQQAQARAQVEKKGLWGSCPVAFTTSANNLTNPSRLQCLIKGNISNSGEKIYYLPGQRYYNQTKIDEAKGERWFCTEEEAQKAGWHPSKS